MLLIFSLSLRYMDGKRTSSNINYAHEIRGYAFIDEAPPEHYRDQRARVYRINQRAFPKTKLQYVRIKREKFLITNRPVGIFIIFARWNQQNRVF